MGLDGAESSKGFPAFSFLDINGIFEQKPLIFWMVSSITLPISKSGGVIQGAELNDLF